MGIRLGLVGRGSVGHRFASLFKGHPLVDRIALCDQQPNRLSLAKGCDMRQMAVSSLVVACLWTWVAASIADPPATQRAAFVPPDRGTGVQVWTCQPPLELSAFDTPPAGDKLEIKLVGIRNARFSGTVVLASAKAITNAQATVSDLTMADGKAKIPAGQILVRYAQPPQPAYQSRVMSDDRFDALLDAPTAAPPRQIAPCVLTDGADTRSKRSAGAMLPVWVTVKVPADTVAGSYVGKVTVKADGLAATDIPLSIQVRAWTMPELKDYQCRNNIYQSHETTALRYGVAKWSPEHFALMGKVLDLTRQAGNGYCAIHFICPAYHLGNEESMVRWIKKGEHEYEYDFTIFEKYLDLFDKHMGKPQLLQLTVYHPYVDVRYKNGKLDPTGVPGPTTVSLLDKATGKVEKLVTPEYGTPEAEAFWKPVIGEAVTRLQKRGWLDVTVLGTSSDWGPRTAPPFDTLKAAWPECKLIFSGHPSRSTSDTTKKEKIPYAANESVWVIPRLQKAYPGPTAVKPGEGFWAFARAGASNATLSQSSPLVIFRNCPEMCLQSKINGVGRVGADFWPLPDRRSVPLCGTSSAHMGPAASTTAFTAAGPDGPVSTTRLEMFTEGMQVREALGFLIKALADKKLGEDLAAKCIAYLSERATSNLKHATRSYAMEFTHYDPDWQNQEARLFALCAEASR